MDIRKLEVYCKVIEYQSFTKAAEWAMISQPTVSEHIRNLEQQFGQKFIDRLGRHVEATPAGKLLYTYAQKLIRLQNETIQAIEEFSGNLVGGISIGSSTIPGTYILPSLLPTFLSRHPDIRIDINIANSRQIAKKVIEGNYDLGIIGALWSDKTLEWKQLYNDRLILAVPPDSKLIDREEVTMADLLDQPFIMREQGSGTRRVIMGLLEKNGFAKNCLNETVVIGSTAAVKEAVKAGIGVSILSECSVAEEIANRTIVGLELTDTVMERPFFLIQRKNRALSPIASVFARYLLEDAGKKHKVAPNT